MPARQLTNIANDFTFSRTICGVGESWPWIQDAAASYYECEVDDVDLIEADDGDVVTVRGEHVARLEEWVTAPKSAARMAA